MQLKFVRAFKRVNSTNVKVDDFFRKSENKKNKDALSMMNITTTKKSLICLTNLMVK